MNVFFDISSGEILKTISGTLTWQQKQVYLDGTSSILIVADDTDTQYKKVNINNDEFTLITDEGLVRKARNKLLLETDWTQLPAGPLTDSDKTSWATYRQELRDLPTSLGWPDVTWPTPPS